MTKKLLVFALLILYPLLTGLKYKTVVELQPGENIQDAITGIGSNGIIRLSSGTYNISSTLTFAATNDNIVLEGSGWGTVINQQTDSTMVISVQGTSTDPAEGIILRNFKITTPATKPATAIELQYCNKCTIEHIHAAQVASGGGQVIHLSPGVNNTIVRDNYIEVGSVWRGIYLQAGLDITASNNIIENNTVIGSSSAQYLIETYQDVYRTIIRNNRLSSVGPAQAISIRGCPNTICTGGEQYARDTVIEGNVIDLTNNSGGSMGIVVQAGRYGTIRGNTMANAAVYGGILIDAISSGSFHSSYWTITGNVCRDNPICVYIRQSDDIAVVGNVNYTSKDDGTFVKLDGATETTIAGNTSVLTDTAGIDVHVLFDTPNPSSDIVVSGNYFGLANYGLYVPDGDNIHERVTVVGNTFQTGTACNAADTTSPYDTANWVVTNNSYKLAISNVGIQGNIIDNYDNVP